MTYVTNKIQVVDGEYLYICGWTTDGRDFSPVGCVHPKPKEAAHHANELAGEKAVLAIVGEDDGRGDRRDAARTTRGRRGRTDRS